MNRPTLAGLALAGALHGAAAQATEPPSITATIDPASDRPTMINILRPAREDQDQVVRLLRSGLEDVMSKQPGFIDASVHRSTDNGYVVVYAHWKDAESLQAAGGVVMSGGAPEWWGSRHGERVPTRAGRLPPVRRRSRDQAVDFRQRPSGRFSIPVAPLTRLSFPMSTSFTAENSAPLLVDHQVGTMQLIRTIDVAQAKRCAIALAKAARILDIPVVLTSSWTCPKIVDTGLL